jgi:hypothetical protein
MQALARAAGATGMNHEAACTVDATPEARCNCRLILGTSAS